MEEQPRPENQMRNQRNRKKKKKQFEGRKQPATIHNSMGRGVSSALTKENGCLHKKGVSMFYFLPQLHHCFSHLSFFPFPTSFPPFLPTPSIGIIYHSVHPTLTSSTSDRCQSTASPPAHGTHALHSLPKRSFSAT